MIKEIDTVSAKRRKRNISINRKEAHNNAEIAEIARKRTVHLTAKAKTVIMIGTTVETAI